MNQLIYIILNSKLKEMENWRVLNTISMLGIVLGKKCDDSCFGEEVLDQSGFIHEGIGNIVLPILECKMENFLSFYKKCKESIKEKDFVVIDFTLTAQNSNIYQEYADKLSNQKIEDQEILGIALLGDSKKLKSLCGNLARWK